MIIYVESNFIVEIALEQEQLASAQAILELAESKQITLIFPNFVFSEPFERIMRESRERNAVYNSLVNSLTSLQRSEPHKNIMRDMEPVIRILREAYSRQMNLLHSTFERLLRVGECINISAAHFKNVLAYQQNLGLSPQDSIIYATIIEDLQVRSRDEEKCFLSRDRKAFWSPDIRSELAAYKCRYIGSFQQGLEYVQHVLQNTGSSLPDN